MCGGTLGDNNVAALLHDGHTVGIQQLAVPLATFSKLELKSAFLVKDLKKRWKFTFLHRENDGKLHVLQRNLAKFSKKPKKVFKRPQKIVAM